MKKQLLKLALVSALFAQLPLGLMAQNNSALTDEIIAHAICLAKKPLNLIWLIKW